MVNNLFLERCRSLIGMSYDSCVCDAVIRRALNIDFKGTNWLFRSINNSSKYRYLTERHACGDGTTPPSGAVVFKIDESKTPKGYKSGPDAYHCGIVDEDGYIIHSSPKTGVRKDLTSRWTDWDYWGLLKHVEYQNANGVCVGDCVGGNSDADSSKFHDELSEMTDRQLLIAIYNAVMRD